MRFSAHSTLEFTRPLIVAVRRISIGRPGSDATTSPERMIAVSVAPPAYPDSMPSPTASTSPPVNIVAIVITTVVRVDMIVRLSRSRPSRSVPSGCSMLGPASVFSRSWSR